MKRTELDAWAQVILNKETARLAKFSYAEIEQWPEYPHAPNAHLEVPAELSDYKFSLMKDTQSDKTIRIAIQLYRHRFLGTGWMTADGFFISPDGDIRNFSEKDVWAVT